MSLTDPLRGNLFAFSRPSWTRLVEILSPLGELGRPSRAPSNALVALCRP